MDESSTFPGYAELLSSLNHILTKVIRSSGKVPKHVAFIMDGNRRYAKKNHIELKEGHNAGSFIMAKNLELCYDSGVQIATIYAFSIENFKRSAFEVNWLMELAKEKIKQITQHGDIAEKYGIRIRVIGNRSLLPADVIEEVEKAERITENNKDAILNICFPYTGREEILHSIKEIVKKTSHDELLPRDIDETAFENNLYTANLPPLDLLIRTSGVTRLSDFLIWQVNQRGVVIEFFDRLWPEFGPIQMLWVLLKYVFQQTFWSSNSGDEDEDEWSNKIQ